MNPLRLVMFLVLIERRGVKGLQYTLYTLKSLYASTGQKLWRTVYYMYSAPEFLTGLPNWVPPPPPPQASVFPPLGPERGEQHSLAGVWVGGPNSDDWTESLVLCDTLW
jgi:hypothetical protein